MTGALSWLLAAVFATAAVAHVVLLVCIAQRAVWRVPLTLLVPPLAPYWGWQLGLRKRVIVWWVAVLGYAVGVIALAKY